TEQRDSGAGRKREHSSSLEQFRHAMSDLLASCPGARDVLRSYRRRPGKAFLHSRAERRLFPANPLAVASPCFCALEEAKIIDPARERLVAYRNGLGSPDQGCNLIERGSKRMGNGFSGEFERILGDEQAYGRPCRRIVAEQRASHALKDPEVARKPAAGIEARRKRTHTIEGDAPVRRSHPEDSTEACRHTYRAAGVAANRKVHHTAGDGRSRPAGRAAGYPSRRVQIHRPAIDRILAREPPGQFVSGGLADEVRARVEQPLYNGRRLRGGAVRAQPVRAAEPGFMTRDIIDVLDPEREPQERPVRRALHLDVGIAAEGAEPVICDDFVHGTNGTQINGNNSTGTAISGVLISFFLCESISKHQGNSSSAPADSHVLTILKTSK